VHGGVRRGEVLRALRDPSRLRDPMLGRTATVFRVTEGSLVECLHCRRRFRVVPEHKDVGGATVVAQAL
jgi:hypothetical protein